MNSALLLGWWKEIAIALLVVALVGGVGFQELRVRAAKVKAVELAGQVAVFKEREAGQRRDQALRELHNLKNKERTDAQYAADLARAAAAVVRVDKPAAGIVTRPRAAPDGGDKSTVCIDRRRFDESVDEFAHQHAERLNGILAAVAQRLSGSGTAVARAGESVAAAYRACQAFAIGVQ